MSNMEVKFNCPFCGQQIETDQMTASRGMECPTCRNYFDSPLKYEAQQSQKSESSPPVVLWRAETRPSDPKTIAIQQAREISDAASTMTKLGGLLIILWIAGLFCAVIASSGGVEASAVMGIIYLAFSCVGLSFWFFLMGQVMHIRAELTKPK